MIKRKLFIHFSLWASIWFVCAFFAIPVTAANLTLQDASGFSGGNITVSILIDDATDILSADIRVNYDQYILTPTGTELTDLTSDSIVAHIVSWNSISIALAGATAIDGGSGALVDISFKISKMAQAGETQITISEAILYGSDYQIKNLTTSGFGTITLLGIAPGDINADGKLDLADAMVTLQVVVGTEPSSTVHKAADVNGDGKIGIEEAIYILQRVSGLRESGNAG